MATSRSDGASVVTSRPPMATRPALVPSRPAMMRRSVDLPQPEGPTKTANSPSATSRDTSDSAAWAPKRFPTPRRLTSAMGPLRAFLVLTGPARDTFI